MPLISAALIAALVLISGCTSKQGPQKELFRKSANIMYTTVSVTVVASSPEQADDATERACDEIRELESLFIFWTDDSEIAAINTNAGKEAVRVSQPTMEIIGKALEISDLTDGAFDATVGPVIRQWDFKKEKLPEPGALKEALRKVDYKAIILDDNNSTAYLSRPEMSFDTGGIAKGFAADRAIAILKALGIEAALVSVSGDIRAYGTKPDGTFWRVGIRDPRSEDPNEFIASLDLNDEAISTSGDYERFFIKDGRRYHHILDPKTGYPAYGSMSVSVIAGSATLTDGLSTGIFVLGPQKGLAVLEAGGIKGVIISSEGRTFVTKGFGDNIRWKNPVYKP